MSETEKRERLRYKQTRKRRIILQAIVIAILLLSFAISGVLYYQLNKTYYIEYSEKGRVDYSVKYFESEDYDEWQKSGKS